MAAISAATYYRWKRAFQLADDRQEPALRARQAVLAAARTVFLRDGFGAPLGAVAALAGVSRQTIYNLFGDRSRLFSEVVNEIGSVGLGSLQVPQAGQDLASWLKDWARPQMQMSINPDAIALLRITMGEFARHPELAALGYAVRTTESASVSGAIAPRLKREMELGRMRHTDPLIAAESFIGACTAHIRHRSMIGEPPPGPEELDRRLEIAVQLFLDGLGYDRERALAGQEAHNCT